MEHVSGGNTNFNWSTWYSHQKIDTVAGTLVNKKMSGDDPNYIIFKIWQNTEKSPGNLERDLLSLKLQ